MCKICQQIEQLFNKARTFKRMYYQTTIEKLIELENQGMISLIIGDCSFSDSIEILYSERHYTLLQYFKCVNCGLFYRIGACIRGTPLYECNIEFNIEKEKGKLWGKSGKYFEENV